jgi:tRNA 2-thiouridine synthesizing protein A
MRRHDDPCEQLQATNAPSWPIVQDNAVTQDEMVVDARGLRCPLPSLRLQRAFRDAPPGARARLLADDPMARIDVPHLAASKGWSILEMREEDGFLSFLVEAPARRAREAL